MEKGRYSAVPIASVITSKADHTAYQNSLIASNTSLPTLCTPRLPNDVTSPTFADALPAEHVTDVINRVSSLRREESALALYKRAIEAFDSKEEYEGRGLLVVLEKTVPALRAAGENVEAERLSERLDALRKKYSVAAR